MKRTKGHTVNGVIMRFPPNNIAALFSKKFQFVVSSAEFGSFCWYSSRLSFF